MHILHYLHPMPQALRPRTHTNPTPRHRHPTLLLTGRAIRDRRPGAVQDVGRVGFFELVLSVWGGPIILHDLKIIMHILHYLHQMPQAPYSLALSPGTPHESYTPPPTSYITGHWPCHERPPAGSQDLGSGGYFELVQSSAVRLSASCVSQFSTI
jgi:hypothetical protein